MTKCAGICLAHKPTRPILFMRSGPCYRLFMEPEIENLKKELETYVAERISTETKGLIQEIQIAGAELKYGENT